MLPIVIVFLVLVNATFVALANAGRGLIVEARAESIADVVALASAAQPELARDVARANAAELTSMTTRDDGATQIRIAYRGADATAAARVGDGDQG